MYQDALRRSDTRQADMAELADALDLGSSGKTVQVQVLSPAPLTSLFELFELLDRYQSEMIDFFV